MTSKTIRGFRAVPKQDGSGKITVERKPYFGCNDTSAKIARDKRNRSETRRRVKVLKPGQAVMFHPAKD